MELRLYDKMNGNLMENVHNLAPDRKLVIFMSWLMAKDRQIEKYRQIYMERGFDVLTVQTYPYQFLAPPLGAQRVAENLLRFLKTNASTYPNVLIHGCSAGAYLFAETMVKVNRALDDPKRRQCMEIVLPVIKGTIFDSIVDPETPVTFTRAAFSNQMVASVAEYILKGYLFLTYPMALKHYRAGTEAFLNNPLMCPALILASRSDKLTNMEINEKVVSRWSQKGREVRLKVWPDSGHCGHLQKYPKDYEQEIHTFLHSVNLYK
jgi:acetyl esterase/lipase